MENKKPEPTRFAMKAKIITKTIMICVAFSLGLAFILFNDWTWNIIGTIITIVSPLVYGLMIAFIINYPYEFFYFKVFKKIGTKRPKFLTLRKVLSIVCTYVFVGLIVAFLVAILIPEVEKSIESFLENLPKYVSQFTVVFTDATLWIKDNFSVDLTDTQAVEDYIKTNLFGKVTGDDSTSHILNVALTSVWDFLYGVYNAIISIIVSIYVMGTKEKLLSQAKRLVLAYFPEKTHEFIKDVKNVSYDICGRFIIGKIIDSAIIGVLCFIGMSIIGLDYPLLISVIVGITNIIPFFGPFIGAIPGALLLLLVDPIQCLWFVIFVLLLQQLDGNVIGPKILGDRIGISGIWVLVGVLIGGGLFGFPGMVFGVPVCAVIYTLLGKAVRRRLAKKNVSVEAAESKTEEPQIDSKEE